MAQRMIDCDLWTNPQIVNDFTAEDKYFWLYLLTNPHNNICGICKVSNKTIANEMGYSEDCIKNLLNRFITTHKLIDYDKENYEILIINWYKFNWSSSPKLKTYIEKVLPSIKTKHFKEYIISLINDIDEYGIDRVSIGYQYPTISISNSNSNSNTKIKEKEKKQIKEISKNKKKPKTESFNSLIFEYTQNKDLQKAINDFIEMRKLNKSAMSMNAVKLLLGRLNNLAKSDKAKIEMLEESILKSWKSVYPKNDTEQKAEQKKAMDIIQNRRMSAERKFVKVKEQIESDAVYSDLSAKVRGLKFDIAKLETQGKPTGDMAERLTKLKKQLADRLAEMGYTAEDLEVKYHCPICQDTGYAKGKKCKCLLALEV